MNSSTEIVDSAISWLDMAFLNADGDVILTSPYLSADICDRIAKTAQSSSHVWTLVTRLDPRAVAGGVLSVQGLGRVLKAGVELRHVERLHAKCFIVGTKGMLGSANLTGAGLGSSAKANRELGVTLGPGEVEQARRRILSWPARKVEALDLDDLQAQSKNLTSVVWQQHDELDAASALASAERLLVDSRDPGRSLWLKLEYGEPALDGWREESWFASPKKGRPGFRAGDLVFICAKETKDCYAVVEVLSDPEFQPQDYLDWSIMKETGTSDRWPWINRTVPRLVPSSLMELKLAELGVSGQGLQNGHVRLKFDQFTAGVRALARLATH